MKAFKVQLTVTTTDIHLQQETGIWNTTVKYHFAPTEMAKIKADRRQVLVRMWGERNPLTLLMGL